MEDASGAGIGEIEETVYDAVSDVLQYAVVEDLPLPSKTPPASSTEAACSLRGARLEQTRKARSAVLARPVSYLEARKPQESPHLYCSARLSVELFR